MGKGKILNQEEIGKIKALKEEGYSNRRIAERIGRSPRVINNFFKDPENYGQRQRGGVKTATTARERRMILREASNSSLSARQIAEVVGTSASIRTVRRIIQNSPNLKRKRLKKKPVLTKKHQEARLQFAQNHMAWTMEWRKVIFTDEKRFSLDGPDGWSYYFHDIRKEPQYLSRRHSRIGSIMVWGAISYFGVIDLVVLEGKQDSTKYRTLLQAAKFKIDEIMEYREWIFQQDHAAIHTAKAIKDWFEEENISVLQWPSLSPDLNIIENLWGWLSRKVYENGKQYKDRNELITAIKKFWNEIPITYLTSLYESIPKRIYEVIRVNGKNTHY